MSLNSPLFYVIPEETVQVSKAAFPQGNRYLLLRDTFGPLFHNPGFQPASQVKILRPLPDSRTRVEVGCSAGRQHG